MGLCYTFSYIRWLSLKSLLIILICILAKEGYAMSDWKFSEAELKLGPLFSEISVQGKVTLKKLLTDSHRAIDTEVIYGEQGADARRFITRKSIEAIMKESKASPAIFQLLSLIPENVEFIPETETQYDFDFDWTSDKANPRITQFIKSHSNGWHQLPYIGIPVPPTSWSGTAQMELKFGSDILKFRSHAAKAIWSLGSKYWGYVRIFYPKSDKKSNVVLVEISDPMDTFGDNGLYVITK